MNSILLEVSVYNDCSTDDTGDVIAKWKSLLKDNPNITVTVSNGTGYSKGGKYTHFILNRECLIYYFYVENIGSYNSLARGTKTTLHTTLTAAVIRRG